MDDNPLTHLAITVTTLNNIARVVAEFGVDRGKAAFYERELEELVLLLTDRNKIGLEPCPKPFNHTASLILEAMIAQHEHDLALAAHSLPPFDRK